MVLAVRLISEFEKLWSLEDAHSNPKSAATKFSARTSRMRDGIYPYRSAEKYNALVDVIRKNDYETIFYNDYYRIYVPVTK
jgi:hypothetical protein